MQQNGKVKTPSPSFFFYFLGLNSKTWTADTNKQKQGPDFNAVHTENEEKDDNPTKLVSIIHTMEAPRGETMTKFPSKRQSSCRQLPGLPIS